MEFTPEAVIDPLAIVKLVQAEPDTFRFRERRTDRGASLSVKRTLSHPDTRFQFVETLLRQFGGDVTATLPASRDAERAHA